MSRDPTPEPPDDLSAASKAWWKQLVGMYIIPAHDLRTLRVCCEAYDDYSRAREVLVSEGSTYVDRFGAPRPRPEVKLMQDARLHYFRARHALGLDNIPDPEPRKDRPC